MLRKIKELVGFSIGLCGIICVMCETEYQLATFGIGIMLLLTGTLICLAGKEGKHGTY